jgi:hypothetical protein
MHAKFNILTPIQIPKHYILIKKIINVVAHYNRYLRSHMSVRSSRENLWCSYLPGKRDPITIHHLPGIYVDVSKAINYNHISTLHGEIYDNLCH